VVDWVRTLSDVKAALVGSGRPRGLRQPERGQTSSCGRTGRPKSYRWAGLGGHGGR
jgi:hypothetical protein